MTNLFRFATLSLLASAFAFAGPLQSQHSTLPGTVPVPSNTGEALYQSKGCYQCHGLAGQGAIGVGPKLHPVDFDSERFVAYVRNPAGEMPPYGAELVSTAELTDILGWLRTLPPPPSASDIPILVNAVNTGFDGGNVPTQKAAATTNSSVAMNMSAASASARMALGAAIYRKACAGCHGSVLEGASGPALRGIGTRRSSIEITQIIRNPPAAMPKVVPSQVSEKELPALVNYLQTYGKKSVSSKK